MSKLRYSLIVVLLLVSISLVVACTIAESPSSASGYLYVDEEIGPDLSRQELVAEVAPAVVSIVTETVGYNWFGVHSLTTRLFKCHNFVTLPPSIL